MEDSLKIPEDTTSKPSTGKGSTVTSKEIAGKIASHIGTGKNAKDSFIWMTITWSFVIASGLSILLFLRSFSQIAAEEVLLDSLTKIWSVFIPIITLALGYAFGKGE
jgi:hypothetical protein